MKQVIAFIVFLIFSSCAAASSFPSVKIRLSDPEKLCPNLDAAFPVLIFNAGIDSSDMKKFSSYYKTNIHENSDLYFTSSAQRPTYTAFSLTSPPVSCAGMMPSSRLGTCGNNLATQFTKTGENIIIVTPAKNDTSSAPTFMINCTVSH